MQSVPDLNKIILLAQIFGVSTDYLLKEEMVEEEKVLYPDKPEEGSARRVSLDEANEFLSIKKDTAKKIAFGVMLCVLSPICLIVFPELAYAGVWAISEDVAAGIGIGILLFLIAAAVAVFVICGMKSGKYEFLDTEVIDTEYGVDGMVKEKKNALQPSFTRNVVLGTCLCILAVIPLITVACVTENEVAIVAMVGLLLFLVAIAVYLFISVGIVWESYKKLLQEDDYAPEAKAHSKRVQPIVSAYWLLATAVYLAWSFITNDWDYTWIVWPVAGVFFGVVMTVVNVFVKKKD